MLDSVVGAILQLWSSQSEIVKVSGRRLTGNGALLGSGVKRIPLCNGSDQIHYLLCNSITVPQPGNQN